MSFVTKTHGSIMTLTGIESYSLVDDSMTDCGLHRLGDFELRRRSL